MLRQSTLNKHPQPGGVCGIKKYALLGSESCKWLYTCSQNEPLLLFAKLALKDLFLHITKRHFELKHSSAFIVTLMGALLCFEGAE